MTDYAAEGKFDGALGGNVAHRHCPHCGAHDIDAGATGLDECRACGGLSRDGQTLKDYEAKKFYENVIVLSGGSPPAPEAVQSIVDAIAQTFDNPLVLYLADMNLDLLDERFMVERGWMRTDSLVGKLRDAYQSGAAAAGWMTEPGESEEEVVARLTMRGTDDAVLEAKESEDGPADQPG